MFCEFNIVSTLFNENLKLSTLTAQAVIFEIFDELGNDRIVIIYYLFSN